MGECIDCQKFVKDPFKRCFPCNQKFKSGQSNVKTFENVAKPTPKAVDLPQAQQQQQTPQSSSQWHPINIGIKGADGSWDKLTIMVNFPVPKEYKAFIAKKREIEPEYKGTTVAETEYD